MEELLLELERDIETCRVTQFNEFDIETAKETLRQLRKALILPVVSRSEPKDTKIVLGFTPESYWGNKYYKQFKKAQDELKDLNQSIEDKTLS